MTRQVALLLALGTLAAAAALISFGSWLLLRSSDRRRSSRPPRPPEQPSTPTGPGRIAD